MKGFKRGNLLLSLCGLNCGLCPMHLDRYCPGCGGGEGNQSCRIARCSLGHEGIEYCWQCGEFPCGHYLGADEYDIFITRRNQIKDLRKAEEMGTEQYNREQRQKIQILEKLLAGYNDGRRKTFFCVAVNLLELKEIREVMEHLSGVPDFDSRTVKEKAAYAVQLFQEKAESQRIELKLRRKPKK